jgi:hypothetical protein
VKRLRISDDLVTCVKTTLAVHAPLPSFAVWCVVRPRSTPNVLGSNPRQGLARLPTSSSLVSFVMDSEAFPGGKLERRSTLSRTLQLRRGILGVDDGTNFFFSSCPDVLAYGPRKVLDDASALASVYYVARMLVASYRRSYGDPGRSSPFLGV